MREKEDKVFLRRVPGADLIDLRLKDAPLRFRCGVDEVFRRALDEADPAIAKIASALEKRVGGQDAELLLLPLGLGGHVDHITARHAAMPFALPLAFGFYEDLPYASREGADQEIDNACRSLEESYGLQLQPLIACDGPDAEPKKRKLCQIYCSQVDDATINAMSGFSRRYEGERIWANGRLSALVEAGFPGWSVS